MEVTLEGVVDPHVHVRQGVMLQAVAPITANYASAMLPMPNTDPPILTGEKALVYEEEIQSAIGAMDCRIIKCIKLNSFSEFYPATKPKTIQTAAKLGVVAAKAYPIGTTTGSEKSGVHDFGVLHDVFGVMEEVDMVLCLHPEVAEAFCFDRERLFIDTLLRLTEEFPGLRIVVEHVTTSEMINTVHELPSHVVATITAHHLYDTFDAVAGGLLRTAKFCKPIHKRPEDRDALQDAATSGSDKFFFGSDSAPHEEEKDKRDYACAGAFTAREALALLAMVFEERVGEENLEKALQHFTADAARKFYQLPPSDKTVRIVKEPWEIPSLWTVADGSAVIPYCAGETLPWRVEDIP